MQFSPGFLTLFIAASSTWCSAQAFNIDTGGILLEKPAEEYGAAGMQSGFWNPVGTLTAPLSDLDNKPTSVTYGSNGGGVFDLEIDGASGGDRLLMDSAIAVPQAGGASLLGLSPGLYDLYVYCWAGNLLGPPNVTFRAFTGAGQVVGGVSYGGTWPGGQFQGNTYDRLRVEVTPENGNWLSFQLEFFGDFNVINGIQLVPVPAPASMALPVIGAMVVPRRRR